jgi:cytochrome P450
VTDAGLADAYRGNSRFLQAVQRLDGLVGRMIDRHLARSERRDDFVTLLGSTELLQATDAAAFRQGLRDGIVSLLFAGMGTTSSAIFWTLHVLAEHPAWRAEVEAEVGGREPRDTVLDDCPNLTATICEALRLYPPIWQVNRQAAADATVGGWFVPAGTTLLLSVYSMHRDPRIWSDPDEFRPQRFLGTREAAFRMRGFLPFGLGRRACIGGQFSLHETALVVASVIARYRFRPAAPLPAMASTLSLVPVKRVPFVFEARG